MRKSFKLLLGLLLAVLMVASVMTVGVFAEEEAVAKIGDTEYATLADAFAAIDSGDVVIDLLADATFDYNARDAYGTADTTSITINGNGNTLTLNQKDSNWASLGMANANGKLVINNAKIEKTGYGDTSGTWNTHAIIFSCNLEMTDVTVNNGIAVQNGATLNNVTINEAGAYYGLWINGNGQTVTVNGGAINATNGGRGIKIADEYVDDPASVTLTVDGMTFNTAKKAAVLVSSKAGATITATDVDIAKVAEDSVNVAWVDEDWAADFSKVTVNGGAAAQESAESFAAALVRNGEIQRYYETLEDAIADAKAGDTVTVFEGTYAVPSLKAGITIEGVGEVLFEGHLTGTLQDLTLKDLHIKGSNAQRWAYAKGDLVFENVTFEATGVYALHFDGITEGATLLYKDCTIIGWAAMSGSPESCVFDGCTIKGNGSYGVIRTYFDATIKDCTFDVANVNAGDVFQDGIHAVGGATVTVEGCTNANGSMSDLVNVSDSSAVVVDDVKYRNPAKIGDTYYATIADAIKYAQFGETVVILAGDYTTTLNVNNAITVVGETDENGNNLVNITGRLNITANGAAVKNLNVNNGSGNGGYINAKDVLVEGCTVVGGNGFRSCYTTGTVTFKDSTITGSTYGIHFDGSAGGNIVIDNCVITGWTSFASKITKVIISDTTFAKGNYNQLRFYQDAELTNVKFNPNMNIDFGVDNVSASFKGCSVTDGSSLFGVIYLPDLTDMGIKVTVDDAPVVAVINNGEQAFLTVADAIKVAQLGDIVTILAGDYTTDVSVNKAITVVGETDENGNNLVNITGRVSASTGATVKNLNVHNEKTGGYDCALVVNGKDIVIDGVKLTGYNGMRYCYATGDITIKNSTINGSNFAVHFDGYAGGNIVIENCDITGWASYAATVNSVSYTDCSFDQGNYAGHRYFNKNVSFTNCDFAEGFKIELKATGSNVAFTDADMTVADAKALFKDPYYVVNGNVTVNNDKVTYVASAYTASGSKYFDSLQDAINEVINGGYITLRSNVNESVVIPAGKKVGIGLNGFNITSATSTIIVDGGELTIDGEGKIITSDATGNYEAIAVKNGGKLTLDSGDVESGHYGIYLYSSGGTVIMNGGSVTAPYMAIVAGNGSVTVNGGILTSETNWVVYDWDKKLITLKGGLYSNCPANDDIAYGYAAIENEDRYFEVKKIDPVAYIGTTGYYTLDAALEAAQAGDVIIVKSCIHRGDLTVNEAVTLQAADGAVVVINGKLNVTANGATVKGLKVVSGGTGLYINAQNVVIDGCEISGSSAMYQSYTKGKVTIKNSTLTGDVYGVHFDGSEGGEIVIENCVIRGWTSFAASIKNVTITNTTFAEGENYNQLRFYQENVVLEGCTFNEKMVVEFMVPAKVIVNDCTYENHKIKELFSDAQIAENVIVLDGKALGCVAQLGDDYFKTLQAAIDACVKGDNVIKLLANTDEDVTIKQTEGVNITIDGQYGSAVKGNYDFRGTITIHGNARFEGAETLTIQYIDFITSEAGHYCIDSNSTGSVERYAHNVTISDCTFTAEGAAKYTAVAVRIRQGFNITIEAKYAARTTAQFMHSLFQGYGCDGVTFNNVNVSSMKNGISVGTSKNVVFNTVQINIRNDAAGYGIRADGTDASEMIVKDANINAKDPIVIRNASGAYKLTLEGTNKLTAGNEKGYQVIFTAGDDGTYELPTGEVTLIGGETLKVYPLTCVTVTLDDVTVVMGNKLPDFTYQLSNPALADKITVTFDAINYTAAGTYTITATVVAPENYEVTVVNGTLTVQGAVVSVKADGITTYYASFDEAWEAAPASKGGVNFILLASVTLDRTYVYNDTNGGYVEFASSNWKKFTITGTTSDPLFKIESGIPKFKNLQISAYGDTFYVTGGSLSIMSVGNDNQNTIVTSETGNVVYTRGGSTTILGGPTLTAYGEYPAIQGNGMYAGNVTIQKWSYVFQAKISAPNSDMAIYWPQNGTLNISFGEITGKTAVWAKSGNIIISGGTFIATGDKVAYAPYNNGANATGDALVIEASANAAYELPVVSITGGTFRSANGEAVAYYTEGESKLADEQFISGGIFSSDVSEICEYGYGAEPQADGTYVVKPMIVINIDDKTMVVGNELPAFTYTVESFGRDVTATLQSAVADTDGKTVGTFTINGTPVAVEGYYVKVVPADLTVVERVVSVDGVGFTNLKDAIASIKKGQAEATVVLHQDITIGNQFIGHSYAQKVVIDLNGHKITSTDKALTVYRAGTTVLLKNGTVHGNTTGGTIQVTYGGKLILGENVTITCGGSANALKVDANSTLIIADETVKVLGGKNDLVVAEKATVEISAGFFKHPVNAEWCAEGYFPITVEGGYSVATGACMIGDTIYDSLADAIEAAQNGDTIVLKNDINVTYADAVAATDGFKSFFVVSDKTITIDLNGKTVYGDATDGPMMVNGQSAPEGLLLGMFTTLANGHLTLVDSSNGQGTVELKAATGDLDANGMTTSYHAYGLIVNYDDDCSIVIEGGKYVADDVYDALVYTSCDTEVDDEGKTVYGVTVDDGYFYLANVGKGSRGNGSPWIFNARGQQIRSVVVNGGTFNANVNAQYWVFEVEIDKTLALKDNGDGTWTVVEAAAYVNKQHWASAWYTRETGYATFEEAIAACEDVKTKTVGKKVYTSEAEGVTLLRDIILDGPIVIG